MTKKFLALICAASFITGCGEVETVTKIPLVKTQQVQSASLTQEENYSGVVKGRYETNLSFQVGGKIISRNVQQGTLVNAGDVLMTLDSKDIAEQSRAAEAQVSSALAQLNLAKSNFERYSALFNENAISAAALDNYKTQYESAVAAYNAAVAQAEQSRHALDYTTLFANADGVISAVNAEVGQVVSAGQPVLTLTQTNELEVEINVPENKISAVNIGQSVTVTFWANDSTLEGRVREISPVADKNSRTFAVKISLTPNPYSLTPNLGTTANVAMTEKNSAVNEVVLPFSAIYQTGDAAQVWLVKDGKVTLKNVETKDFESNSVKVSGLSQGDVVVTAGVNKLREGQEVRLDR